MKKKIFALFAAFGFVLNAFGAASADTKTNASQTNQLVTLLPASNGVFTFDAKRLFNDALPQILSANPLLLTEITGKIDDVKTKTGIDLRQFEQIAVGFSGKQTANEVSLEPVVLARGSFNAPALLALAKIASKGKYREEKIGGKTVFVFKIEHKEDTGKTSRNNPTKKNSLIDQAIDKMFDSLTNELAVAAYDNNTLALGTLTRLRETFQGKARVNNEILSLINRKPNAILSFAANFPLGLSPFLTLDNDELGKNLDAIRQISGSMDVSGGNASVSVTAKTLKPEQAQNLQETVQGLQSIGKAFLGNSKSEDKQVYGRMIDNARITRAGSEVMLDLQVPQSDIDVLVSKKK